MGKSLGEAFLELAVLLLLVFGFAFPLNFLWEALHAVYLYQRHDFDAATYVPMLLYVATTDGLLIEGLYLGVAAAWRRLFWIEGFRKGQQLAYLCGGGVVAAVIEYRAVFVDHRWAYKPAMPTVFGIGLSPLIQLSVTGLVSIGLARAVLYGNGWFRR
jgi:hypothetical protein